MPKPAPPALKADRLVLQHDDAFHCGPQANACNLRLGPSPSPSHRDGFKLSLATEMRGLPVPAAAGLVRRARSGPGPPYPGKSES